MSVVKYKDPVTGEWTAAANAYGGGAVSIADYIVAKAVKNNLRRISIKAHYCL